MPPAPSEWQPSGNFITDFVFGYGDPQNNQNLMTLVIFIGLAVWAGVALINQAKKGK
jgi:hypothetical protein